MMKTLSAMSTGILVLAVANPALAHIPPLPHKKHFSVAGTALVGGGTGYINGTACTVTISPVTSVIGPDVNPSEPGHTATGHADYATVKLVNSGSVACNGKTLDVTLYPDGDFTITAQTGLDLCFPSGFAPVSGSADLSLSAPDIDAHIDTMAFGLCTLAGDLFAGPATIIDQTAPHT